MQVEFTSHGPNCWGREIRLSGLCVSLTSILVSLTSILVSLTSILVSLTSILMSLTSILGWLVLFVAIQGCVMQLGRWAIEWSC
jgi:hypothetical protein